MALFSFAQRRRLLHPPNGFALQSHIELWGAVLKSIVLAILMSCSLGSVAQAKQIDLCSAEEDAKDGSQITTVGEIVALYDNGFQIGEPDGFCGMNIELKGKRPAACKVGAEATVTGTVDYFFEANDLVDATAKCRAG